MMPLRLIRCHSRARTQTKDAVEEDGGGDIDERAPAGIRADTASERKQDEAAAEEAWMD